MKELLNMDRTIPGFRLPMLEVLTAAAPKDKAARAGYLSALYALRANMCAPAYMRSWEVESIQRSVRAAIASLEQDG